MVMSLKYSEVGINVKALKIFIDLTFDCLTVGTSIR